MNPYFVRKNFLPDDLCDDMIQRFEKDSHLHYAGTIGGGRVDLNVKNCVELHLTSANGWENIDKRLCDYTNQAINDYHRFIYTQSEGVRGNILGSDLNDPGYKIKRYSNSDCYFHWHHDMHCENDQVRIATILWYLNDVDEGGETEFNDGRIIKPEKGKMLIFPATWSFIHRGKPPVSGPKYLLSTFIYGKMQ